MKIIEPDAIYTYQEVQDLLGIKKTTMSGYIRIGALKPIRLGKTYRFFGHRILAFLKEQE